MTPAEKPSVHDKNLVLVLDVNREIKLPIPVARPANRVKLKASNRFSYIAYSPLKVNYRIFSKIICNKMEGELIEMDIFDT